MTALQFRTLALSAMKTANQSRQDAYVVGVAGFLPLTLSRKDLPTTEPITWPPRLRVVRSDGAPIEGPRGDFWFAYPRAVVDASGTLHVLWAEPDLPLPTDPRRLDGQVPTLHSVWYATLRSGSWSRPARVYRNPSLGWDEISTSRLVRDSENGLHLAFSVSDTTSVIYLSAPSAPERRWRSIRIRQQSSAGYLDLATGSGQQVAIVFTAGVALPEQRVNVAFLTRSHDGGRTWSEATQVSGPAEEPAIEPHVFIDRLSAVRLVWVQQATSTFVGGKLWHVTLADSGRRSARALALPLNMMTSHSEAILDGCDTVHLFTVAYPEGGAELRYTRTTSNGWTPWMRPFEQPGGRVSIEASEDMVHLVWSSHPRASGPQNPDLSGLAYSTLPVSRKR
ncbi:MAG TPA: hypothetical protein VFI52_10295 [Gemmatimonadaceae bacterium]|nr:hypothetical protein [Gemmatimonadaceae bacterium]